MVLAKCLWKYVFSPAFKQLTRKTTLNFKLDDIFFDSMAKPITVAMEIMAFYATVYYAPINDNILLIYLSRVLKASIIICFFWGMFNFVSIKDEHDYEGKDFAHVLIGKIGVDKVDNQTEISQEERENQKKGIDAIARILATFFRVFIFAIGFCVVCDELGFDVTAFVASLSIGTAALAFAAKDLFGDVFGSIVLLLDKPFDIGDWVVANGVEGIVEKVSFRSTRIRTLSNEVVHMPSSMLTNTYLTNNSDRISRRIRLNVVLSADTEPDKIKIVREEITRYLTDEKTDYIEKKVIRVNLKEITKFGFNLEITCFTPKNTEDKDEESNYQEVVGKVNEKIVDVLHENEVKLVLQDILLSIEDSISK